LPSEVSRVHELHAHGFTSRQIADETGIPRGTVRKWLQTNRPVAPRCDACGHPPHRFGTLPVDAYAYLLGIYLGDGTISRATKGVWSLRIFQDERYPGIVAEIASAMAAVMPTSRVAVQHKVRGWNLAIISSYSRSWPCLFPQAGPGMKHTRKIELTAWQWGIVWQEPGMFLRGLIHSDGCRVMNQVMQRKYAYPRYLFSNESLDIQQLFRDACDLIGIEYRNNRRNSISVARRASVAKLDEFIGPKT
jgi:hypothetical protein